MGAASVICASGSAADCAGGEDGLARRSRGRHRSPGGEASSELVAVTSVDAIALRWNQMLGRELTGSRGAHSSRKAPATVWIYTTDPAPLRHPVALRDLCITGEAATSGGGVEHGETGPSHLSGTLPVSSHLLVVDAVQWCCGRSPGHGGDGAKGGAPQATPMDASDRAILHCFRTIFTIAGEDRALREFQARGT